MKHLYNLMTICVFTILFSCSLKTKESNVENENSQNKNLTEIQRVLIDYKSDTYKIYFGEKYYENNSNIAWRWDAKSDPDGKIDSTGKDFFYSLGEPIIKYNNQSLIPALYMITDKNNISAFSCSINFKLDNSSNASQVLLGELSQYFKQLNKVEIINTILDDGSYQKDMGNYVESFELKISENSGYDILVYTIATKNSW